MVKGSRYFTKLDSARHGFGLLEVLISVGILATVMAAAVYAGRISVRNNIIANQRAQAYNLVRQNLEMVRQMRDTTWVDGIANEWNSSFTDVNINGLSPYHINFADLTIIPNNNDGSEIKELDGSKFSQKLTFFNINDDLRDQLRDLTGSEYINLDNYQSIVNVQSQVSWQSYGKEYNVTGTISLTDWKPQI